MSSSRATFISGMTFGIALGLVAGHFFIWQHQPNSPTDTELGAPAPYFSMEDAQSFEPVAVDPPVVAAVPHSEQLFQSESSPSPLDHAIAISDEETVVTAQIPDVKESTPEPQPLAVDEAAPLDAHNKKSDAEIRSLIDLELPNAPQAQRDVWFDALRDLGEEDVAGVLRMWKLFGGPQTDVLSDVMPKAPDTPELATPLATAHQSESHVSQQNLSMIDVPGYKRLIPVPNQNEPRVDFQPGAPVITDYPLDVALQGPGFFKLKNQAGETFYTRNGQLCVLSDRTIGLRGQAETLRFVPLMTVPDEATGPLKVSRDGAITIGEKELGTLSVVTFWNLDHLTPATPGVFSATEAAMESPISFELLIGAYEGSNVAIEREQISLKLETLK